MAIIPAASKITAAPTTIRLTNSSNRTVCTAAWVSRNADSTGTSGVVTAVMFAAGANSPVSPGGTVLARLRLSSNPCAPSASTPPTASGYTHCRSMARGPECTFCMATSWSGSAKMPPTQYWTYAARMRSGTPTVLSFAQNDEFAPRMRMIAVMTILDRTGRDAHLRRESRDESRTARPSA